MASLKYLIFLVVTTLSAQVRLRYLDFGPVPTLCCMVTDAEGNAYVAGTYVTGTIPAFSAMAATPSALVVNTGKIAVYKLNPTNGTIYRTIFGGSALDTPTAIALDANGNLFVAGTTTSADFPLIKPLIAHGPQGFLSKLDATGNLVFSTFIGGSQPNDFAILNAIALDTAGNVYVTGSTSATDYPVTSGAYNKSGSAFVTKIANSGSQILFSTFIGSGGVGQAIAVDKEGAVTVGGSATPEGGFPATPGAFQTSCNCGTYLVHTGGDPFSGIPVSYAPSFVLRLSADGSHLIWSTYLGGGSANGISSTQDAVQALVLTADGGVVVSGAAESPDFPVTPGAFQSKLRAQADPPGNLFIARFNSGGTALESSTLLGGSAYEQFGGLQLDAQEHPWVTGTTISLDFPLLPHSLNLGDEFLVELASDGSSLLFSKTLPDGSAGLALALGASGSETVLGSAGSFMRIPAGGLSQASLVAQMNAEAYTSSNRVAPGEAVTLFGTGLGPFQGVSVQPDAAGQYPTEADGVQVTCDGIPAPLLYVSTHQINAVIPFEVSGKQSTLLRVTYGSKTTPPLELAVVPAYPEIFSVPASSPQYPPRNGVVWNENGTVNSGTNPAFPASKITFWVNGAGLFAPALGDGAIVQSSASQPDLPVTVLFGFGGNTIPATYGAAPDQVAGLLQVTATVPPLVVGVFELQVQVGAFFSDPISIFTGTR